VVPSESRAEEEEQEMFKQAERLGQGELTEPGRDRPLGGVTAPLPPARRRFLIVQIDGLSHAALEQALRDGTMPALARLLGRGGPARHAVSR
jgi:hypothetical protein